MNPSQSVIGYLFTAVSFFGGCFGFVPVSLLKYCHDGRDRISLSPFSYTVELHAVSKRQTAIFDGAELASMIAFMTREVSSWNHTVAPVAPKKRDRVAAMTIVTGTTVSQVSDDKTFSSSRIVGIEKKSWEDDSYESEENEELIFLGDNTYVYADSVAKVPQGISDADAISTASSAICGVHCGAPRGATGKAVVVGGGDYACFVARGLEAQGAEVSLVTSRPGVRLAGSKVQILEPAEGKLKLGFGSVVGKFDSLIDTLGDEARLGAFTRFSSEDDPFAGKFIIDALKVKHNCERYISTVTRSQKYVIDKGLLFARNPVLQYQFDIENKVDHSLFQNIRPPKGYGSMTLQKLFDNNVVLHADKNENGFNANKNVFVRGWALSDLAEFQTWPSASATVRFGFPVIDDLNLSAGRRGGMISDNDKETATKHVPPLKNFGGATTASKKQGLDPYVMDIPDLTTLNHEFVSKNRDGIIFFAASYCRTCYTMGPEYTRMARMGRESFGEDFVFSKVDISAGMDGKEIGKTFGVEVVPSFLLFKEGEPYGSPLRIKRVSSKKLKLALEYLQDDKEWDPEIF